MNNTSSQQNKRFSHFILGIITGTLIAVILHLIENHQIIKSINEFGIDFVMNLYRNTPPEIDIPHFVALDIDEDTYAEWNEPIITPRDKLKELIEIAVEGKPRFIIVDIELDKVSCTNESGKLSSQDEILHTYLNNYSANCKQTSCPHVILMHSLRNKDGKWIYRKAFGGLGIADSPYLCWAAPVFENVNSSYGNLRYWHLSTPVYSDINSSPVDVLSVQSLSTHLLHLKNNNKQESMPTKSESDNLNRRVIYTLPWKNGKNERYPHASNGMPLLNLIPANQVLKANPNYYDELLKDSIVVIGGSYKESRDIHPTALGYMPGYLVIVNSIISLARFGELEKIGLALSISIEFVLILLIALIFMKYNSLISMVVLVVLISLILVPLSVYLFKLGTWLNFLLPLLSVILHQFDAYAKELKELQECKK